MLLTHLLPPLLARSRGAHGHQTARARASAFPGATTQKESPPSAPASRRKQKKKEISRCLFSETTDSVPNTVAPENPGLAAAEGPARAVMNRPAGAGNSAPEKDAKKKTKKTTEGQLKASGYILVIHQGVRDCALDVAGAWEPKYLPARTLQRFSHRLAELLLRHKQGPHVTVMLLSKSSRVLIDSAAKLHYRPVTY